MNQVVLVGRLTRDPELRQIQGGSTSVANFSLAIDRDYTSKDGNKQTDFIDIEVWNKAAENCVKFIGKGSLVGVIGSIRVDNYENTQGEKRRITKVRANSVQFLESRKNKDGMNGNEPQFQPNFNPSVLDVNGFQAIDDDDVPF